MGDFMPRVSAAFFALGATCVLLGMIGGMWMGATHNFVAAPAHAHLNLLGWVTMALFGTFYALTRDTMSVKLAWTNFILSALGVLVLVPSLTLLLLNGNDPAYEPGVTAGSALSFASMAVFAVAAFRELRRAR
jgi:hypothetical protein